MLLLFKSARIKHNLVTAMEPISQKGAFSELDYIKFQKIASNKRDIKISKRSVKSYSF